MSMNRRTLLTAPALVAAATLPPALASARPAEPVTQELLESYNAWLFYERRLLAMQMYPDQKRPDALVPYSNGGCCWHFPIDRHWTEWPQPSTRAASVLSIVGCDWRVT